MKKILVLAVCMVVILTGCSKPVESKQGSAYVDYYTQAVEKANPGITSDFDKVLEALDLKKDFKDAKKEVTSAIDKVLKDVPDQVANVIFDNYKKVIDANVVNGTYMVTKEQATALVEQSKTDLAKAQKEATDYITKSFQDLTKSIMSIAKP